MAKQHVTQKQLDELHDVVKSIENGACLTGHEGGYKKNKSCSYRWQAHHISIAERKAIYNDIEVEDAPPKGIRTSAYKTKKGKTHPAAYVTHLPAPKKGDWDLEGPPKKLKPRRTISGRSEAVPKDANFTKDRWPYWHNAHHLIPKSLLNDVIDGTGKGQGANPQAPNIIRKCLLKAKYNVNFEANMIILPQDREVGKILKLPRHLILIEISGDGAQIQRSETACHEAYDRLVRSRLEKIMSDFAGQINKKTCEDPADPELARDKLNKLSKTLYDQMTRWGRKNPGAPIADMAKKKRAASTKPKVSF